MKPTALHRRRWLLAAALWLACGAALAAAPVPAFTARYQLLHKGSPIGTATITLSEGPGGAWTFTTVSRGTSGLASLLGASTDEKSVFHWVDRLPQCDSYDYQMKTALKQRQRSVRCDWPQGTIAVDDKGMHRFAGQPGTLERHTVPLALAAGLASGARDFTLPVAVRDRVQMQHYVAQGRQQVSVPAGTFDAIEVRRTGGGDDSFEAWFAPDRLPVPVKIDQGGKGGFALLLESWSAS